MTLQLKRKGGKGGEGEEESERERERGGRENKNFSPPNQKVAS